jgi:hypothetical protein
MPDSINTDNVRLNEGTGGALVATDLVFYNGVTAHAQYVKLASGVNDEFIPVGISGSAAPLPISIYTANNQEIETTEVTSGNYALSVFVKDVAGFDTPIPVYFGLTDGSFLPVAGSTDGSVGVLVRGSTVDPLTVTWTGLTVDITGLTVQYNLSNYANGLFGVTGDVIGVFNVRGLSAGTPTGPAIDSVAVQGISGGRAVRIEGVSGGVPANVTLSNITTNTEADSAVALRTSQRVLGVPLSGSPLPHGFTGTYGATYDHVGVQGLSGGYPLFTQLVIGGSAGSIPAGYSSVGVSGGALQVTVVDAGFTFDVVVGSSIEVFGFTGQPGLSGMPSLVYGVSGATWSPVGISGSGLLVSLQEPLSVSVGSVTVSNSSLAVSGTGGTPVVVAGNTSGGPVGVSLTGVAYGGVTFDVRGITGVVNLPTNASTETTLAGIRTDLTGITNSIVEIAAIENAITAGFTAGHFKVKTTPQSTFISGSTAGSPGVIRQLPGSTLSGVKIKAGRANADPVYLLNTGAPVGVTTDAGYPLAAGEEVFLEIDNLNKLYYYATGEGALYRISYIGS